MGQRDDVKNSDTICELLYLGEERADGTPNQLFTSIDEVPKFSTM